MLDGMNLAYIYDGSFDGLLCCVYESLKNREMPGAVMNINEYSPSLFAEKSIKSDAERAMIVRNGIISRISRDAFDLLRTVYLSCRKDKELLICDFVRLGFINGACVTALLGNSTVNDMLDAAKHLGWEVNKFKGFIRFSISNETLVAVIEPKNFILPMLVAHFCDRFKNENFIIYDKTHAAALIYKPFEYQIFPLSHFEEAAADEKELEYRRLWKTFYDKIAIKERENPRCRMSLMPKRYWKHMTEFQDANHFLPEKNWDSKCLP